MGNIGGPDKLSTRRDWPTDTRAVLPVFKRRDKNPLLDFGGLAARSGFGLGAGSETGMYTCGSSTADRGLDLLSMGATIGCIADSSVSRRK